MKIIISDLTHDNVNEETATFSAAGLAFEILQCQTEDDLIRQAKGAAVVLNQYAPFTPRVFAALAPELRQIVRYGVGYNNVDIAAATAAGVQVCNVPDYGMMEVSDHALALTLALARKIVLMNDRVGKGEWDYQASIPIRRLSEQTVGVVGLGRIGRLYARKMAALGCRVIGYDLYYKPNAADGTGFIEPTDIDTLLSTSEFVAIFCPLTAETRNLIDAARIARMKDGAIVVNTSRGGIIDEAALAAALKSGKLGGAGLDTTDKEPLEATSPLRGLDSCVVTPHMAWYSEEAGNELKRKAAEEAVRFVRGEPVHYPVNKL
jgi:D-3-phosphoglycerate dehydrogenase